MYGEIGDWVFSEENRKESKLLANRQKVLEIWNKVFGNLEQTCGEIRWRFVENIFGDLEKTYSAILGKNLSAFCLANLEKSFGASFGETYSVKSFGDLEKSFGASFGDL